MRFWFDTEFIERPCTIDLISIGIVCEDSRTFYAESNDVNWYWASEWVKTNVRPHLRFKETAASHVRTMEATEMNGPRSEIGAAIRDWIAPDAAPEIWAYYGAYDWVVFCWLQGAMIDLPNGWPMFCRDVKQLAADLGDPELPSQESTEHHALADALWTRDAWLFLDAMRSKSVAPAVRPEGDT